MGMHWTGVLFGLGDVIAFGNWTTDFLAVQGAIAANQFVFFGGIGCQGDSTEHFGGIEVSIESLKQFRLGEARLRNVSYQPVPPRLRRSESMMPSKKAIRQRFLCPMALILNKCESACASGC